MKFSEKISAFAGWIVGGLIIVAMWGFIGKIISWIF